MVYKHAVVAAFHILLSVGRLEAVHFKNSHGNYIIDHGKIMELCF